MLYEIPFSDYEDESDYEVIRYQKPAARSQRPTDT
jgi:hypothetical protein